MQLGNVFFPDANLECSEPWLIYFFARVVCSRDRVRIPLRQFLFPKHRVKGSRARFAMPCPLLITSDRSVVLRSARVVMSHDAGVLLGRSLLCSWSELPCVAGLHVVHF